jgi:hypothetical protein
MDAAYLKAAHPEPYTILGKKLKPFCLGHEILFQRFGNKFSVECSEDPSLVDLLTGVFICSQPYTHAVSLDNFAIPIRVRLFGKLMGYAYLKKAAESFARYIADHTEIPHFDVDERGGGDEDVEEHLGTPSLQAVKISLMANLGLSEMEALNTPFSLAFWNHLSFCEYKRALTILDAKAVEREKALDEAWAGMEEAVNKAAVELQREVTGC